MNLRTEPLVLSLTIIILALTPHALLGSGVRQKISVPSTIDGTDQPCYLILPEEFDADGAPVPLLVSLRKKHLIL